MGRGLVLRRGVGGRRQQAVLGSLVALTVASLVSAASCSSGGGHPPVLQPSLDGSTLGNPEASSGGVGMDGSGTPLPEGSLCTLCAGQCVNINIDSKNCGGCAQPCGTGVACVGGTCACPAGKSLCNNKCVDLPTDPGNCGFCGHNCQGTTCTAGLCPTTAIGNAESGQILQDMVIDATEAYWSWQAPNAPMPTTGGVTHKAFAGGAKQDLLIPYGYLSNNRSVGDMRGIWVDQVNLYMTDFTYGTVFSYDLPSTFTLSSFYEAPIFPPPPDGGTDGGVYPTGDEPIAVTADSQNVYWVDYYKGTVVQEPIAGGNPMTLASGRLRPVRIAVAGGFVYWIDYGTTQANTGSVNKVARNRAGGAVTPLAASENQPRGIATDGTNVYWTSTTNTGLVSKVSVNGGPTTVLAQNQGGPWAIVVDQPTADAGAAQTFVYWTNYNDNNIQKVPTSNTGPSAPYVLASAQNNPVAIAVDAKAVYWANQGDGTLWKVAK